MIAEITCAWCLCYATSVSNGGQCHSCGEGSRAELAVVVKSLDDPNEMLTAVCHEKGQTPVVNFKNKQGVFPIK